MLIGREFQTGKIRTKKESWNMEERAERRRRSRQDEEKLQLKDVDRDFTFKTAEEEILHPYLR